MSRPKAAELREQRRREYREQQEYEQQRRLLAVITEFGGRSKRGFMLTPDPIMKNEVALRLAGEVLLLREQIGKLAEVVKFIQAGAPFAIIPPGPLWKPRRAQRKDVGLIRDSGATWRSEEKEELGEP
jgi:hypothetical protein